MHASNTHRFWYWQHLSDSVSCAWLKMCLWFKYAHIYSSLQLLKVCTERSTNTYLLALRDVYWPQLAPDGYSRIRWMSGSSTMFPATGNTEGFRTGSEGERVGLVHWGHRSVLYACVCLYLQCVQTGHQWIRGWNSPLAINHIPRLPCGQPLPGHCRLLPICCRVGHETLPPARWRRCHLAQNACKTERS